MSNIFRLMKLARSAYKAAPVVIPIGLVVAKYAMNKLRNQGAGKARTQSSGGMSTQAARIRYEPTGSERADLTAPLQGTDIPGWTDRCRVYVAAVERDVSRGKQSPARSPRVSIAQAGCSSPKFP